VAISDLPRDQGFTRPKVLLLLPMRSFAYKVVTRLVHLALGADKGASVHNLDRWGGGGCGAAWRMAQAQAALQGACWASLAPRG
jgi:hypothetical protein